MNLYGGKGIGKTTFICHYLNEMKKRNLYPDGEYFIRLSDLRHHHDSVKDLFKSHFGEKFDLNMNEYFKNTKKLIVIDDFSKIVNVNRYRYPTFFLRALRVNNIHAIFISRQKLPIIEEVEPCVTWQMKPMTNQQALAYMLVANKRAIFNVDADISSLEDCMLIRKCRGEPYLLDPRLDLVLTLLNNRDKGFKAIPENSRFVDSDSDDDVPDHLKIVDNFHDDYTSVGSLQSEWKTISRANKKSPKKDMTNKHKYSKYHSHRYHF